MNIRTNHQLIPRDQSYVLDRKLVTIHSNDRDIKKFPNSNNFEVTLPEAITNVDSMRLSEIQLPTKYYNFSDELQNTKIKVKLGPVNPHVSNGTQTLLTNAPPFVISIPSGLYNPNQLANTLSYHMNKVISDYLAANGNNHDYSHFKVYNDETEMKFWIGNNCDGFTLYFDDKMDYVSEQCDQNITSVWDRYSEWGFGYNLGFEKERYAYSTSTTVLINSSVSPNVQWLNFTDSHNSSVLYYIKAPLTYKLMNDKAIYMEVEKYNHIDELVPYSQSTNSLYNNDFNGTVNSAFAKIPIDITPFNNNLNNHSNNIINYFCSDKIISSTHFDPPLERIQKLKFKFRNHNGVLIDFLQQPFNFTVEFNCLRNEISRQYSIRIPAVYSFK